MNCSTCGEEFNDYEKFVANISGHLGIEDEESTPVQEEEQQVIPYKTGNPEEVDLAFLYNQKRSRMDEKELKIYDFMAPW